MDNPHAADSVKTLDVSSSISPETAGSDGLLTSSLQETLVEADGVLNPNDYSLESSNAAIDEHDEVNRKSEADGVSNPNDIFVDDHAPTSSSNQETLVEAADEVLNPNDSSLESSKAAIDEHNEVSPKSEVGGVSIPNDLPIAPTSASNQETQGEAADGVLNPYDPSLKSSEEEVIYDQAFCPAVDNPENSYPITLFDPLPNDDEPQPLSMVRDYSWRNGGSDDDERGREDYRDTDHYDDPPNWMDYDYLNPLIFGYPHHRASRWDRNYQTYRPGDSHNRPRYSHYRPWMPHGPHPREEAVVEIEATGVGAGLNNLYNTCFINAILQCFLHTVPLIQGLRFQNHISPCSRAGDGFCVICELRDQSELSFNNSGSAISPTKIVQNLKYFSSSFEARQQEDAHEFLQCFLDKLEMCCLDSNIEDENLSSQEDVNLVKQVFGGRSVSKLQCCECGHTSDTYEPLIDLSLEIGDVYTLPCALESFTNLEKLDTKFTCENCKEQVMAEKQMLLDQSPTIATFHLKRFKTDENNVVEKIDKHVEFPLELDLQPYTSGSQNTDELKYTLYGVLVHRGRYPTAGHYFCYIQSSPGVWHKLDDETVVKVDEEHVLSQRAYILFYAKHGTPWFTSVFEVKKPCVNNNDLLNSSPKSVLDNRETEITTNESVVNADSSMAEKFSEVPIYSPPPSEMDDEGLNCNEVENPDEGGFQDINESMNSIHVTDAKTKETSHHDQTSYNEKSSTKLTPPRSPSPDPIFRPLTPPKSPSPDAALSSHKGGNYNIPRSHLKTQNQVSSRKPQGRDLHKKEAVRYVSKNMAGSRGMKFMNLILASSGGSPNKKRRGSVKKGSPNARRKLNNQLSGMPGVAVYR